VAVVAPPKPKPERKLRAAVPADKRGWWWGTGRRKAAVARVRLRPAKEGEGKITLRGTNEKDRTVEQYFSEERDRADCFAPLKVTGTFGKVEVTAQLHGGGYMGQAGAVMLGIARALRNYDPTLEGALREHGMLTRDAREVERKKYGQAGARRRFQFSKR
jgi:small subunit ribosomal protein S9